VYQGANEGDDKVLSNLRQDAGDIFRNLEQHWVRARLVWNLHYATVADAWKLH
jgi:hypothetical protein